MKAKKKKKRKIRFNYVIILGVFIYIFLKLINNIFNSVIPIATVEYGNLAESIEKSGVIIRNEKLIFSKASGQISYFVNEGKRIPKNEKIAEIEIKKINPKLKEKLDTLNRRIEGIKINRDEEILKKDMEKINRSIHMLRSEIKNKIINKDIKNIQNLKEDLLYVIDKKSLIWGEKSIVGKNLKTLEEEKVILENKINNSINLVLADEAGVVSFNADGLEEILKVSSLDKLDSEYLLNIKNNKNKIVKDNQTVEVGNPIAKIVNNHMWYIAVVLDKNEKDKFKVNKKVKIEKGKQTFSGIVKYLYKDKLGKYIAVFEINEDKIDFYSQRVSDFKITYKRISGIKIPKNAITTKKGKKGVYVISETGNAVFKELKSILGENNEYVVLNYTDIKKNRIDTVDLYDELILNPKNIKEGQKVR
ncbi:HlyD family efflux transporter periplasmic adaptor subunit [Tepidibacter thalassicus]|uniref:HlyD family efflux transporter periplasmic adaptor subunit n=1 Tax=Tepidibacter thalassicus TaxID=214905 RepID=UPI001FA8A6A0|nr:HlyD family efflux transporter periplasmic adaptor subunit [Tepidibacter thalassicus]